MEVTNIEVGIELEKTEIQDLKMGKSYAEVSEEEEYIVMLLSDKIIEDEYVYVLRRDSLQPYWIELSHLYNLEEDSETKKVIDTETTVSIDLTLTELKNIVYNHESDDFKKLESELVSLLEEHEKYRRKM